MKKKIIAIILLCALALSCTACDASNAKSTIQRQNLNKMINGKW